MHLQRKLSWLVTLAGALSACASDGPDDPASEAADRASVEAAAGASSTTACQLPRGPASAIKTAKLYIEYNATDEDFGVHGAFDDNGYSELCVYDPSGAQILALKPQGQLRDLTMAGIFFESREPPVAEYSFADLMQGFPEGRYGVRAITFDGKPMEGAADFTHLVPAAPVVTTPADSAVVPVTDLVIRWKDVTETFDGQALTITGYEVIVTKDVDDDPNGFSRPTYDVHLPADRNSLSVPVEFLEPGTKYELEVLALEVSGNQTISVSFFETE